MPTSDIYIVTGLRLHDDEKLRVVELEPWDEPVENPNYSKLEDLKRTLGNSTSPDANYNNFMTTILSSFTVPPSLKPSHSPALNVIMVLPRDELAVDSIEIGTKVRLHISKFEE